MASAPDDRTDRFTPEQRAGLETRQEDQDRTLEAMHRLEAALESASPGRESSWREEVLDALTVVDESTTEESENAWLPDSLLSDVARTQPRLRNRVRALRIQYQILRDRIASLRKEIGEVGDIESDAADLRQRLGSILAAFHLQRARESDLIYEAYYEAFRADLENDHP
jgi:phage shock protein A